MSDPEQIVFQPQPGPQTAFLSTPAEMVVYGGGAGGGKTRGIVLNASRGIDIPKYRALILRRLSTQLTGGGSVWEDMRTVYGGITGARGHYSPPPYYTFEPDASIETGHLQYVSHLESYQSLAFAYIAMDEAPQFEDIQIWYMRSRLRTLTRIRTRLDLTGNPDPDCLIRELIDQWLDDDGYPIWDDSGIIRYFYRINEDLDWDDDPEALRHRHRHRPCAQKAPTSFTFIPARLEDNPALVEADPTYRARLEDLPKVERERLLYNNWNIRPSAGDYFQPHWFRVLDEPVAPIQITREVRWWDFAATSPSSTNPDPDWTRGVRLALLRDGTILVRDICSLRDGPHEVDRMYSNTASQDGREVTVGLWQDPGAAGKADIDHKTHMLVGHHVVAEPASKSKETYAGPVSTAAKKGDILLERGPWNAEFLDELHSFPDGKHDDIVDALSGGFKFLTGGLTTLPTPTTGGSYKSKGLMQGRRRGMWR